LVFRVQNKQPNKTANLTTMTDTTNTNTTPNKPLHRIGRFALVAGSLLAAYVIFQPLFSIFTTENQTQQLTTFTSGYDVRSPFEMHFTLSETSEENILDLSLDQIVENWNTRPPICINEFNLFYGGNEPWYSASVYVGDGSVQNVMESFQRSGADVDPREIENIQTIYDEYGGEIDFLSYLATYDLHYLDFTSPNLTRSDYSYQYHLFEEICHTSSSIDEFIPHNSPLKFYPEASTFYFPFDRRITSFAISAPIRVPQTPTSTLIAPSVPRLFIEIDSPNWVNQFKSSVIYLGNGQNSSDSLYRDSYQGPATVVSIVQQRPLSQRILTAVLLTSILIFILSLLFVKETGTFLEVAVGILLGLWGVQDILIPGYITSPTLINTLILAFYVLLAFIAAIRFAVIPLWHRLGPTPQPHLELAAPPTTPDPPALPPVVIQSQKRGVLQWVTAVSAIITAIFTFLHFIRRKD